MGNFASAFMEGVCQGIREGALSGIYDYRERENMYRGESDIKYGPYGAQVYLNADDAIRVALGTPLETVLPFHRCDTNVKRACQNLRGSDILMSNHGRGVVINVNGQFGCCSSVRPQ